MITRLEVLYSEIDQRATPYDKLVAVCGKSRDGTTWRFSQREAIEAIKSGALQFIVKVDGQLVQVVIGRSPFAYEYLKSQADRDIPATLLDLPRCPADSRRQGLPGSRSA